MKVAIIGSGIIGVYLGNELSKKGHEVTIFEKNSKEKTLKKSCSTLVSKRFLNFINVKDEFIENTINECHIVFKNKKVVLNLIPEHIVINREKLLNNLIINSKANIIFEKEIKEIPKEFDYVIDASGVSSFLQNKDLKPKLGIQVFSKENNNNNYVKTFKTKNGFEWIIPRGDITEYGIFEKDISCFNKKGFETRFALIPTRFNIPKNDKYTLCGDSTGLVKPWSGGGLIWQLYSANFLIDNFPNFKEYRKKTYRFFQFKLFKGKIANYLVPYFTFLIPKKLNYDNDFLAVLFKK